MQCWSFPNTVPTWFCLFWIRRLFVDNFDDNKQCFLMDGSVTLSSANSFLCSYPRKSTVAATGKQCQDRLRERDLCLNDGNFIYRRKHHRSLKVILCGRQFFIPCFCLLFDIWTLKNRVGEAANPGPGNLSAHDTLNIGALNTTGIFEKDDQILSFGQGIWSICETHATVNTQKLFRRNLASKQLHCSFSPPVKPIGPKNGYRGIASGVACITHLPIRTVRSSIPSRLNDTSRILVNHITINCSTVLLLISIYGPATGISTISDPQQLFQELISQAVHIASTWQGPAIILGDFNQDPEQYQLIQNLLQQGWIDAHFESHRRYGHHLKPTCILPHGTSRNTRIYLNSQCARSFHKCETWNDNLFPNHPSLILQCRLSSLVRRLTIWQMPKTFDDQPFDEQIAEECAESMGEKVQAFNESLKADTLDLAAAQWTEMCEQTMEKATVDGAKKRIYLPKAFFGRSKGPKLVTKDPTLPFIHEGRDGDFNPGWGQASLQLRRVCRQARRLTTLSHLLKARSREQTPANESSCKDLWKAICDAKGFYPSFPRWYVQYYKEIFPLNLPDPSDAEHIREKFQKYCEETSQSHMKEQRERTKEFFLEDWKKGGAKTFAQLREDPIPHLPFVVDSIQVRVIRHRWSKAGKNQLCIDSSDQINIGDQIQFQGQHAVIQKIIGNTITLDKTVFLRNQDFNITIKRFIYDPCDANQKVANAWNGFFQKDKDIPIDSWTDVENMLPRIPQEAVVELPHLDIQLWRKVHSKIPKKSARGPCGFSVIEMQRVPDWLLHALFQVFTQIQQGKPWPSLWVKAFTIFLPKTSDPQVLIDNRPITILSRIYRMWSRFYSISLLVQLGSRVPRTIGGGTKDVSALMLASHVQELLETQHSQKTFLAGLVIDLVKCFNTIPRFPLACFMCKAGWPNFLVQSYQRALHQMERSFVLMGQASDWYKTYTGIPEGCPLAVPAMLTMSITAFRFVQQANPQIDFHAYADNWAMLFAAIQHVGQGVTIMDEFCNTLKLQISVPKSWLWSNQSQNDEELQGLRLQGFLIPVLTHAKDLGVDVSYRKGKKKVHLQKRLKLGLQRLGKMTGIKSPPKRRNQLLQNGCFAKANFGAEIQYLTKKDFNQYRIATNRAIGRGRSGASPWLSLSLVDQNVDFEYKELWRKMQFWRRYLSIFPERFDEVFKKLTSSKPTNGPIGCFRKTIQKFFQWDEQGNIVSLYFGTIQWWKCSKRYLDFVTKIHWNCYCCSQLQHRKAFTAFAIDTRSYTLALGNIPENCRGPVVAHSCGTHYTSDTLVHYNGNQTTTKECPFCQQPDSVEHRLLSCPAFAKERYSTVMKLPISYLMLL